MIHGIYIKNKPKNKWHLISLTASPEAAKVNSEKALEDAIEHGYADAQSIVQIFDAGDYIPEVLREVKDQKLMYN